MHQKLYRELLTSFLVIIHFIFFSAPLYAATTCKMSFQMVPSTTSVVSGGQITYTVIAKNIGSIQCRAASVSLFYSPNEIFVSSSLKPTASNYYWYLGTLGINKTYTFSVMTRQVDGTQIITEGCSSARNGADACAASQVDVQSSLVQTIVPTTQSISSTTTMSLSTSTSSVTSKELGIWIWNFPSEMNTVNGAANLQSLASYGFNTVYITIDDYLDIAAMPEGVSKDAAKAAYFAQLATFIQKANALGMKVDAEGGANDWAESQNHWKGFALIDAVKEYNALYPSQKLRGFQYDVEPHTLPDYETNKAVRLTEYVTFIDQSIQRLLGTDIMFTIVIPHFYDDVGKWTPAIAYNGTTAYTFNHLLTVLEKKPGSQMLIMAYRDFFDGANGTRDISEVEVKEASAGYSTNIIIAQETGNVDPSFVTFYGSTKKTVLDMLQTIGTAYASYSRYGGTAVHYMDPFLGMKEY